MIGTLREAWRIVSSPLAWFGASDAREPVVLRALGAALLAGAIGFGVGGFALSRATGSAPLAMTGVVTAAGLGYLLLVWFLGGVVLSRPARLELRAWEVSAWSWLPAGFLGASLLPVVPIAPWPSLAVGVLAFPAWNLWIVVGALRALAPDRVRLAALIYVGAIFAFPLLLSSFTFWVIYTATAG